MNKVCSGHRKENLRAEGLTKATLIFCNAAHLKRMFSTQSDQIRASLAWQLLTKALLLKTQVDLECLSSALLRNHNTEQDSTRASHTEKPW